ncbi:uncharacterized protein A1O9_03614 [Exophiala aquamarina CBS 119918]|uniref:Protein YOP1 n=1 Tax=Exophiala aquamarina CBS 119918 TaxID=1182545 RepID=A0A072PG27_9EURO|nr:uncharacterized protein A1O9_03614 [Exophiala aquamarina CBS 119918]KEF58771.1 hypothetical protein A1O9_03614 [Exophiala aquamarina CBS 119918]
MFGLIADLISSVTTILLPAYLSYKALRTNDPAQTHPWLIYFTILSLTLLAESWTFFILGWVPFYSWFRLMFMLYLVLPQTQGAKILYLDYLEPYIVGHETRIDEFIGQAHARLQQLGLGYINTIVEYLREKVLGQKSPQPLQPQNANYASYAQDLLSRFTMPGARTTAPTQPGITSAGVYGMVSNLAGAAFSSSQTTLTSSSRSAAAEASQIPASLARDIPGGSSAEKTSYIQSQRDRLTSLLRALDTEQQTLDLAYGAAPGHRSLPSSGGGLTTKSRSEQSFENVDYDDATHTPGTSSSYGSTPPRPVTDARRTTSGNWIPSGVSGWFAGGDGPGAGPANTAERDDDRSDRNRNSKGWQMARDITEDIARGMSSGVDPRR